MLYNHVTALLSGMFRRGVISVPPYFDVSILNNVPLTLGEGRVNEDI